MKAELEAASDADELLQDRIVEAIGDAVQAATRDHKHAGLRLRNGEIAAWFLFRPIESRTELQPLWRGAPLGTRCRTTSL